MQMQSVVERFAHSVAEHTDRTALVSGERRLTYGQLAAQVAAIRELLGHEPQAADSRIGVLTGDDPLSYASILAVLTSGAAYVPLNDKNPPDRNRAVIEEAGLTRVLQHGPHESLDSIGLDDLKRIDTSAVPDHCAGESLQHIEPAPIAPEDLAYIFFTSGSTGRPKGVPIRHGHLASFLEVVLEHPKYGFSSEDRFLQMFEQTFDLSVFSTFAPLSIGAELHVVPTQGILYMSIARLLDEQSITVALMVPSVLFYLQRFFDELRLEKLRVSLFCGEALPQTLVAGWAQCVPQALIQNVYGPTEATIWCLEYDWQEELAEAESLNGVVAIGEELPRMQAVVVDESLRSVADGERGELCLIGAQVAGEYWRNATKTAEAYVRLEGSDEIAYKTGDIAFRNERGQFVYCGRADFQVKVDGHRVELAEIEHYARECTGQSPAAVVPITGPAGTTLCLFVERGAADPDEIKAYLRKKLPPYMQPRRVREVDSMPLNQSGKIDRPALSRL